MLLNIFKNKILFIFNYYKYEKNVISISKNFFFLLIFILSKEFTFLIIFKKKSILIFIIKNDFNKLNEFNNENFAKNESISIKSFTKKKKIDNSIF